MPCADLSLSLGDLGLLGSTLRLLRRWGSAFASSEELLSAPRNARGTYTARSGLLGFVDPDLLK